MRDVPKLPVTNFLMGNAALLLKDPVQALVRGSANLGGLFDMNIPGIKYYIVSHPDYVQHVMVTHVDRYPKSADYQLTRAIWGNGLLSSEGDFWRKQRRIIQPAFHKEAFQEFARVMVDSAQRYVDEWVGRDEPSLEVDLADAFTRMTLDITLGCLFSASNDDRWNRVQEHLYRALHIVVAKIYNPLLRFPWWVPTPGNVKLKRSMALVDEVIYSTIDARAAMAEGTRPHDLLTMLMEMHDAETAESMSRTQVRDEIVTMVLAGHETSANALCWAFHLIAQHPDAVARIRREFAEAIGDDAPRPEHFTALPFTTQVIEETMRLIPAAWFLTRTAAVDDEVDGFKIPKGAWIGININGVHRHPDFWPNPDEFDPDRFAPERRKTMHKQAFIPFSTGPRMCIGAHFAMLEMKIILPLLLQRLDFARAYEGDVEAEATTVYRPKHGLRMTLSRRPPVSEQGAYVG